MKEVSLKDAQVAFQKTITWIKKSGKGIIEWQKTFYEVDMQHKKLKTLVKAYFVSKVIMFQETLEYVNAINICYMQQNSSFQTRVPSGLTWAIARMIMEIVNPIVHQSLSNQKVLTFILCIVCCFGNNRDDEERICTSNYYCSYTAVWGT